MVSSSASLRFHTPGNPAFAKPSPHSTLFMNFSLGVVSVEVLVFFIWPACCAIWAIPARWLPALFLLRCNPRSPAGLLSLIIHSWNLAVILIIRSNTSWSSNMARADIAGLNPLLPPIPKPLRGFLLAGVASILLSIYAYQTKDRVSKKRFSPTWPVHITWSIASLLLFSTVSMALRALTRSAFAVLRAMQAGQKLGPSDWTRDTLAVANALNSTSLDSLAAHNNVTTLTPLKIMPVICPTRPILQVVTF